MSQQEREAQQIARWLFGLLLFGLLAVGLGLGALWWGLSRDGLVPPPATVLEERAPVAPNAPAEPTGSAVANLQIVTLDAALSPVAWVPLEIGDVAVETDGEGRAQVALDHGSVQVDAQPPWRVVAPGPVEILGDGRLDVVVDQRCAGDVWVVSPDGRSMEGWRLSIRGIGRVLLDERGRATLPERRCGAQTVTVYEPRHLPDRRSWRVDVEIRGEDELIVHLEGPGEPRRQREPRDPLELREIALTLECVDCPDQVSCRYESAFDEQFCVGSPPALTCTCAVDAVSVWGTWTDVLTESGSGEPIGVIPPDVGAWTLALSEERASLSGVWTGLRPCTWRLDASGSFFRMGSCMLDGSFEIEDLFPGTYDLTLAAYTQRASWSLTVMPGEDVQFGDIGPGL